MSKSNEGRRENLKIVAFGSTCIILLLVTYAIASNHFNREIYLREETVKELNNQVSNLQELLEQNKPQILDFTQQITNLADTVNALKLENNELTKLTQKKQYQLMLAWHEIYVLRNQTERLESQMTELEARIEASQVATIPAGVP